MKYLIYIFLLLLSFTVWSCSCEEEQGISPLEVPDTFEVIEFGGFTSDIFIQFESSVDTSTVKVMETVILTPPDELSGDDFYFILDWDDDFQNLTVLFSVFNACESSFQNGQSCPIEFRLVSDKNAPLSIRSLDGQLLDGDNDGSDGGDFVFEFSL